MPFLSAFIALITCLPDILKLLAAVGVSVAKSETNRKVKSDLEKITNAFKNHDADALRDIFRN